MTVLVVCDSQLVSDRIVDRLSTLKRVSAIVRLQSSEVALRFPTAESPEVVIVDVHLETGNGMDLLRDLARREPHPIVIAVSRSAHPQYFRQSLRMGAAHFVMLPEEIDKLTEIVDREP